MADPKKQADEKPQAVTYYALKGARAWEVWRVTVFGDKVRREKVLEHADRRVVRERLTVLLNSAEVLP